MKLTFRTTVLFALLLLAAGLMLVFSAALINGGTVFHNVFAGGIDLSGLTGDEALATLTEAGWQERSGRVLTVRSFPEIEITITPEEAGIMLTAEQAVEKALQYGRDADLITNLRRIMKARGEAVDVNVLYTMPDEEVLAGRIALLQAETDALLRADSWQIDRDACQLVMHKGQGTLHFDPSGVREKILDALVRGERELDVASLSGESACPDFQSIYDAVHAEMQNAHYATDGTRALIPEQVGYRFDVSEAVRLWEEAELAQVVRIPLEVTLPSVTAERLEQNMFHDLLGAVTTKYNNSGPNRCSNVRLAAEKISGTILYPGEEFSFNTIVGARTEEAGFLPAPAYAGYDDITEEIGGGVCQVSTGVYAASLFAFLEIRSHTCHIYPPNYIQLGMDATVSIPEGGGRTIDLKVVNSKIAPIRIDAYCEETERNGRPYRTVTVEIWGMLEDEDYMPVEFDNSYSNIYDYDRLIDPAWPDREGYKIKFTHEENEFEDDYGKGLRTLTHRLVYDAKGNLVEDRIINPTYSAGYALDTYYYMG